MENETRESQDTREQILSEVKTFAKAEYDVARLQVINQVSHLIGSLLLTICLILIAFAVLTFGAAAAVFALAQCMPTWAACLVAGAVYLLLIPLLLACSKVLFTNPIVNKLSGLKNLEELKCETIRAEGNAALQRERMNGRIRFAHTTYLFYSQLVKTVWQTVRNWFNR